MAIKTIPFDLATAMAMPDWRAQVAWPLRQGDTNRLMRKQLVAVTDFLSRLDDSFLRDTALLASHGLLLQARAVIIAAMAVDATETDGVRLVGEPLELAYLRGDWPVGEPLPRRPLHCWPRLRIRMPWLRRSARLASWTPWWRLPAATFFPAACAVSHNGLLRDYAAHSGIPVGYAHGDLILDAARVRAKPVQPDLGGLSGDFVSLMLADIPLAEPYRGRTARLLQHLAASHLAAAAADVSALRDFDGLPETLWSGTGGAYASRALGLEAIRRGGTAMRFDHGGATGFVENLEFLALIEFAVSSDFVTATKWIADALIAMGAPGLTAPLPSTRITGHTSDPTFRRIPVARPGGPGRRLRVVYAPTVLLGFRQLYPCLLPDVVYLDWQLRLVEQLLRLPIDLICKPHPEGLLQGRCHPLADFAPTHAGRFEALVDEADVFIFDYAPSTAFWEAACTDRRVVLVDLGIARFTRFGQPLIDARCRVITADWDADNRPVLSQAALAEAVLGGPIKADPTPFRRVLAGDT